MSDYEDSMDRPNLYDQDGEYWGDLEYEAAEERAHERYQRILSALAPEKVVKPLTPQEKEALLRWEHELNQPNYYDYFLEEVTR